MIKRNSVRHKSLIVSFLAALVLPAWAVSAISREVSDEFLGPTKAGSNAGFITPVKKNIDQRWGNTLFEKGSRRAYQGPELHTIGMPCGGIGAGQLYVRGDGTLARWLVFGQHFSTHWGKLQDGKKREYGYHTYRPKSELLQGFALQVNCFGKEPEVFTLSEKDFDDIHFIGEYPIAEIHYRSKSKPLPVKVKLEVFMPWIPLSPRQSSYPATVMRFTLENTTDQILEVNLAGWLENGVCLESKKDYPEANLINQIHRIDDLTFLSSSASCQGQSGPEMSKARDFGTMGLALLGSQAQIQKALVSSDQLPEVLFAGEFTRSVQVGIHQTLVGALGRNLILQPHESGEMVFLVVWHFPNYENPDDRGKTGAVGRMYANWSDSAFDVAKDLSKNFTSLDQQTHLFRDCYYDTTLPYWFAQRVGMPVSTLSTLTSQWWKNGRFYNYEGAGFCAGSCTHVYVYAHAMSRLFPSLERNIRQRQDLCVPAQDPESGRINFRGRDYKLGEGIHASGYAADGQCGVVLRAYREHLMSTDNSFLASLWPQIKLAMEYMIAKDAEDGTADGVIRRRQHSTWDTDFYGANTYIGSLYLAALRASEQMARIQGDEQAAERYHKLQTSGSEHAVTQLWNGDYFIQTFPADVPVKPSSTWGEVAVQYQNGCFSNQVFGQNYASQLGLGYLYPQAMVTKTLRSIYRYNWLPDMKYLYQKGKPYAYVLAQEGQAGLLQGSWPLDERPLNSVKLMEHVWTGFEYQVASHMLYEGLTKEAFAIVRGIHDRYDGTRHNPWNEIEGGDHYGRAMASWACLTNVSGFQYNGPKNELGFAPRFQPENFKAFYSSAQGWGSLVQQRHADKQVNRIDVKWGCLKLQTLKLQLPEGKKPVLIQVIVNGKAVHFSNTFKPGQLVLSLHHIVEVPEGSGVTVRTDYTSEE